MVTLPESSSSWSGVGVDDLVLLDDYKSEDAFINNLKIRYAANHIYVCCSNAFRFTFLLLEVHIFYLTVVSSFLHAYRHTSVQCSLRSIRTSNCRTCTTRPRCTHTATPLCSNCRLTCTYLSISSFVYFKKKRYWYHFETKIK